MSLIDEVLKEICSQSQELSLAPALTSLTEPKESQVGKLCDKLDRVCTLLIKNSNETEKHQFHLYYANLLGFIFGTGSFCGWITFLNENKPVDKNAEKISPSASEKLLRLLSPGGNFFQVVLLLQEDENFIYNLKVEYLPPALINENKREVLPQVSNLFKDRLFEIPSEKIASKDWVVRFNAYELYIYSLVTYLLTQDCKNPTSSKEGQKTYLELTKKTFSYILPNDSSVYEKNIYAKYHFKTCSFIKQKNISIPVFFMELFSEIWLIPSTKLVKSPSPYYEIASEDNSLLPSVAGYDMMKVILEYLCKNFQISLPISSDETSFNTLGTNLWRNILESLQPRLYHFFKSSISCRKVDSNYVNLLKLWKSYILPWDKDFELDDPLWKSFILYNFFFYKEILLEFSQRCLISEKISQSLGRTPTLKNLESFYHNILEAISKEPVLKVLREGECNLQSLPRQSLLHLDFNYDYLPLFPYNEMSQSEAIKQQLKDILFRFESSEFNYQHITASNKDYLLPELHKIFAELAQTQTKHLSSKSKDSKTGVQASAPLDLLHTMKDYCVRYFSKTPIEETLLFDSNVYLSTGQYQAIINYMKKSFWPSAPQSCNTSQVEPDSILSDNSQSLPSLSKRSFSFIQSSPNVSHLRNHEDDSDVSYKRSKVPGEWFEFRTIS